MVESAPSAAVQVAFLQNVQRLLAEGSFTATYKFALFQALADLAVLRGDDSGDGLTLQTRDIAEAMIGLYWQQALPYLGAAHHGVLRQNTNGHAEIVTRLLRALEGTDGSFARLRQNGREWDSLVRAVDRIVRKMPLWRLQQVADTRLDFLYAHTPGAVEVRLRPGVAYCLRSFHGLISELVRGAWVRFVRRRNLALVGETADLAAFLFGTERAALGPLRPLLADIQGGECFYCRRLLRGTGEVDHFIPWSRYPLNLGHNFVLAHAACNRAKSSHLAAVRHLMAWKERAALHGAALDQGLRALRLDDEADAAEQIARWAYAQAERAGGRTWVLNATFEDLSPAWRSVLI
jgi:HNH endonuclease